MFGHTPLVLVETPEALEACAAALSRARVIGVDTESDSSHHYREKVCLLQVSDLDTDFVIDPLAVPGLGPLGEVFANPEIVKVFHGADYDVVCMKRDFGFQVRRIFDTMIAAQFLGLPRVGLADLVGTWWGVTLDKKWQRHDWAARPLLDEHLDYARGDSHWLPALRDILVRRLQNVGRLDHVLEECVGLEAREWVRPRNQPDEFTRIRGSRQLDATGLRVLRALYGWRDGTAESQDRPPYKVLPDEIMIELAQLQPGSMERLEGGFRRNAPFIRRYGRPILEAIEAGLADDSPLPPPPSAAPREEGILRGPRAERLMASLKDWRNAEVIRRKVPPVAVASNGVLRDVVKAAPRTRDALAALPDVRRWQLDLYGDAWLQIVGDVLGSSSESESSAPVGRRRRRRRGAGGGDELPDPPADEPGEV